VQSGLIVLAFFISSFVTAQVEVVYGNHPQQRLDFYAGESKNSPIMVFVHGGSWKGGDKQDGRSIKIAQLFQSGGYAAVAINYRLSSDSNYTGANEMLSDINCALYWAKSNAELINGDPDRLVLFGNSAGAHLSVLYGMDVINEGYDCSTQEMQYPNAIIATSGMYLYDTVGTSLSVEPWVFKAFKQMLLDSINYWNQVQPFYHTANPGDNGVFYLMAGIEDTIADPLHSIFMHEALLQNGHCSRLKVFDWFNHNLANDAREGKEPYVTMFAFLDSLWNKQVCVPDDPIVDPTNVLETGGGDDLNLGVFPNPISTNSSIHYRLAEKADVELTLIDALGNVVFSKLFRHQHPGKYERSFTQLLGTQALGKGLYSIRLRVDEQVTTQKISVI